ncbi:hypothetical protein CRG98_041245 [Punica granatum]|uniref:Uncharacterized protein n=1 Tax=Punica granatum TaxID=22663 RepID=A0A2I0I2W8_PUNGR|nr:hypothetical protein CRG98_041245 [Punica granatum]
MREEKKEEQEQPRTGRRQSNCSEGMRRLQQLHLGRRKSRATVALDGARAAAGEGTWERDEDEPTTLEPSIASLEPTTFEPSTATSSPQPRVRDSTTFQAFPVVFFINNS